MAGYWGARCDAFTLAFIGTPLQLGDIFSSALDVLVYDLPEAIMHFRLTKREEGPMDVSFLDLFMALLHFPLTTSLMVLLATVLMVLKAPALLLRAYLELWGRSTFYGFNPRHMRARPLLAIGFVLVNVCMPLLLVVVLVWTPLWALWHGSLAAALIPMLGLPITDPLQYFGLPWGYGVSKLLLLHSESNAFILGSATNLVSVYGVSSASAEGPGHVLDFKAAAIALAVGMVSLVCVPPLMVIYLLAVTPIAIITLYIRTISNFVAEKRKATHKIWFLMLLLCLMPLVLCAVALGMALSPLLAVLPASRAYSMGTFAGGMRGIVRVVLLVDFRITKSLYQLDDVTMLSSLPAAVWELGMSDQQDEGGAQGVLGRLPSRDAATDRSMIDPMAEHVAAQMQARVYGTRGTMSAAAKRKAAELKAAGVIAEQPPATRTSTASTGGEAIEGPAYAVPPHMRKHTSAAPRQEPATATATADGTHSTQGSAYGDYEDYEQYSNDEGAEYDTQDESSYPTSQTPSRTSSQSAGAGAVAVKRTVRGADGEEDLYDEPCCACCLREDPLALDDEEEADEDEEAPAYSAEFTITDAPPDTGSKENATGAAVPPGAEQERETEDAEGLSAAAAVSSPIDVSRPLSSNTTAESTPAASQQPTPSHGAGASGTAASPKAVKLTMRTAARLAAASSPARRRARATLPPHLRAAADATSPSVPSGKRQAYGMPDEPPLPQEEPQYSNDEYADDEYGDDEHDDEHVTEVYDVHHHDVMPAVSSPSAHDESQHPSPTAVRPPAAPVQPMVPAVSPLAQSHENGDTAVPSVNTTRHPAPRQSLVSHATAATHGSSGSVGDASPVADSETPVHANLGATTAAAVSAVDSPSAQSTAVTSPGASSTTALRSAASAGSHPTSPAPQLGFGAVVAAAKMKAHRSRAQEALARARAALAEVEGGKASKSALVDSDPVQLRLSSRARDRSQDAKLATSAPKPATSTE